MARQPIFDNHNKIFGYELLYRSGMGSCSSVVDGDQATLEVIRNSFTLIGLDMLTDGKRAFINFTQNLLQSDVLTLLYPEVVVIEILENVRVTTEVIEACAKLKSRGFLIALDDYDGTNGHSDLLGLADIVKVDFMQTDQAGRAAMIQKIGLYKVELLAEKVETYEEYNEACQLGFKYFQGYFFGKPLVVSSNDIADQKVAYLRLVRELYQQEVDFDEIENIFKYNMAMTYKLLRLVNSAAFGLPQQVDSIRQALILLGINEIKKWSALIAVKGMGEDKPKELVTTALVRAKICETLAPLVKLGQQRSNLFLLGMFSLIDIMLDRRMADVLRDLPLNAEVSQALLGKTNSLRCVLDLILAYEAGSWGVFEQSCLKLGLPEATFADIYLKALVSVKQYFI